MAQLLHQTLTQLVLLDEGEHVPETQAGRRPIINQPIVNHEGHVGEKQILSNHKWRLTHSTVHGRDLTFDDDQAKTQSWIWTKAENLNSKTLFYKDCSLGLVKNLPYN